jgi:hypothetical protein
MAEMNEADLYNLHNAASAGSRTAESVSKKLKVLIRVVELLVETQRPHRYKKSCECVWCRVHRELKTLKE